MTAFSTWLSSQRKRTGKSQAQLAATMGISPAQLSQLERGLKRPTSAQVKALAKAMRVKAPSLPQAEVSLTASGHRVSQRRTDRGAGSKRSPTTQQRKSSDRRKDKVPTDNGLEPRSDQFKHKLWTAADKLRGNMDASEYKHVVLGLIFLKYISDAFNTRRSQLSHDPKGDPENREAYVTQGVFWLPLQARWADLQARAKELDVGKHIDDAMMAIEQCNPGLKGVLPKDYGRPQLDQRRLGEVLELLGDVELVAGAHESRDLLGEVYEYFLGMFAAAEGKRGGEFFTPASIVRTLVRCVEPYSGRIYDPCCGSGGMFVQSERFVETHGGRVADIAIYGQESNATTWRLCRMNLSIRNIACSLGPRWGDTFHEDHHPNLKADFILANPPFNASDWGRESLADDPRWAYGPPPSGNANFAWLQHIVHHLSPNGFAGVVLANGSMSSQQSGEGELRRALVEADLVDCMIALPSQLFRNTGIPACMWLLARSKTDRRFRKREGEVLFIDARKLGTLVERVLRELDEEDIARISGTYLGYRGAKSAGPYQDIAGFCKVATLDEIASHQYVLSPGRYVGVEAMGSDGEAFEVKMPRLVQELEAQFSESARLENVIRQKLRGMGYGK